MKLVASWNAVDRNCDVQIIIIKIFSLLTKMDVLNNLLSGLENIPDDYFTTALGIASSASLYTIFTFRSRRKSTAAVEEKHAEDWAVSTGAPAGA